MSNSSLKIRERKDNLEKRLKDYGIDCVIEDDSLFDVKSNDLVSPNEAADRLLVLLAVALTAYDTNDQDKTMNWLKKENLWDAVSPAEKDFFRDPEPGELLKAELSWRFEGAYILAWCLQKVKSPPDPGNESTKDQVADFFSTIPLIGSSTAGFHQQLSFRKKEEIIDENLFYEFCSVYFMDIAASHNENTSTVDEKAAFERYRTLNWLRGYKGIKNWDETDPYDDDDLDF